jgi:hypothetical protein
MIEWMIDYLTKLSYNVTLTIGLMGVS